MGVLGFADGDLDAEMANDETAAEDLDKLRMDHINSWRQGLSAARSRRVRFGRPREARST